MTSIYDHFDVKHKETKANFLATAAMDPPSSGYVTFRTQAEPPIFTKQKMKLNLPEDIVHMTVSKNWLICLMSHNVLLRLFLPRPEKQDEVFLDNYVGGYKVTKIFLDPTGNHLLISLFPKSPGMSPDLLYLHLKSTKPRRIDRFKDHEITAVAFNYNTGNESTTGPILLGTSRGLIFEAEFGMEGDKMLYRKQVFDIGREKPNPITGLEFFAVPTSNQYIVMAATADRLYKFQENIKADEKFSLQAIFSAYVVGKPIDMCKEVETDLRCSMLKFNIDMSIKYPTHFGWLTGRGILHKDVDDNASFPDFVRNKDLISLPSSATSEPTKKQLPPLNFIITNFHALLLYPDHVTAVCLLNQENIYEEYFSVQYGKLLGIVKDINTNAVYAYTSKAIFRYRILNEQRNVWQLYLDNCEYTLAEKFAKDNPAHLDIVLGKKAEDFFASKRFAQSAEIYSKTRLPFENIALKFFNLDDKEPIMIYLRNRLDQLSDEDQTQITMLVVWLIELYLTQIAQQDINHEKAVQWQRDYDGFMALPRVAKCVRSNRTVIYDLMASHGDSYNLSILATVNKDYESVINQHITQRKYSESLRILKLQNSSELFYKYCPILMEEIPHETISAIMSQENRLKPEKILPTLICIQSDEHIFEIIRYLEYSIYSLGTTKVALHNYLLKLYAQHKPEKLLEYLETQGRDVSLVHYDVRYALKVCQDHEARKACVMIQCLLEMWDPAVEVALQFDSALAKDTASQPTDVELKRKLWLRIAQHEIKGTNDVKKALELLNQCDLLRIEDLLPYFSDFEKIDDFKEAICDALKEYNIQIQELQKDMDESTKSADRVRNDLKTLRGRSIKVEAQDKCAICEIYLLIKPFFIFPCGHKFHGDCLEKQINPMLSSDQSRKLTNLKHQLESLLLTTANSSRSSQQENLSSRDKIKAEIEQILAADCLFCGVMIESLDKPFIEDWEQVNVDWD